MPRGGGSPIIPPRVHPYLRARLAAQMFLCGAINGAWQPVLPPYLKQMGLGEFEIAVCLATVPVATRNSPATSCGDSSSCQSCGACRLS